VNDFEIRVRTKDHRSLDMLLSARPFTYGNQACFVCVARDISERKKTEADRKMLESQLQQAQKMEAIGTLAGGIAHDFNNILGSILGYTELARLDLPKESLPRQQLDQVLKSTSRARARPLMCICPAFSRSRTYARRIK